MMRMNVKTKSKAKIGISKLRPSSLVLVPSVALTNSLVASEAINVITAASPNEVAKYILDTVVTTVITVVVTVEIIVFPHLRILPGV